MFMYDMESFDICLDIEVNRKKKKKRGWGSFYFLLFFYFIEENLKTLLKKTDYVSFKKHNKIVMEHNL